MKDTVVLFNPSEKEDKETYIKEVLHGLSLPNKQIPFKFVYDEEGSKYITLINASESYYLCKCETQLFNKSASDMLALMGRQKFNFIDLGAGDASKTSIILKKGLEEKYNFEYIPLDISHDANLDLIKRFSVDFPELKITALTSQFQEGIQWVQTNKPQKNVYIFVGGTIGNGTVDQNDRFAKFIGEKMKKGDQLFVAFDKMKDPQIITRAYLDNGYEKMFISNSLKRLNKDLQANFDLQKFYAFPCFDPLTRCISIYVVSSIQQDVTIAGKVFHLEQAQAIKTGMSRKWLVKEAIELFKKGGLQKIGQFTDSKNYFMHIAFEKK